MKCSKIFKHFHRNGKYCPELTNFFRYFYWKLQKHSTWDNVVENLIQQLVFLPREILQCGGRKSILMKVLVSLCLKTENPNNDRIRQKLNTFEVKNYNKHCEILVSCSDKERNCIQAHWTSSMLRELHASLCNLMQAYLSACKLM